MESYELRQAATIFLTDFSVERNLSQKTVKNKKNFIGRFLAWLNDKPFTIENCREYIKYLTEKGYKASSIKAEVKNMRALCTFLYKRKYMSNNFAQDIAIPIVHKEPLRLISPEIAEQIIFAGTETGPGDRSRSKRIKEETRLALRFLLRTGLRITEVQKMRGEDLNLDEDPPTFYVHSKGGDTDLMPFPRDMIDDLKPRLNLERVFEVTQATCNDVLQRGAAKIGINKHISNHTLRHVFATSNLKNGIPLQVVSRLMRHNSVAITDSVYSHYDVNDLSVALNNQPLVKQGLTIEEVLENLEQAIKHTGIEKDSRFKLKIGKSKNIFTLEVKNTS